MASCNHWPGQLRCEVCGMDNRPVDSADIHASIRFAWTDLRLNTLEIAKSLRLGEALVEREINLMLDERDVVRRASAKVQP